MTYNIADGLATLMRKFFAILAALITGRISKVSVATPQVVEAIRAQN